MTPQDWTAATVPGEMSGMQIVAVRAYVRADQPLEGPVFVAPPSANEMVPWGRREIASPMSHYEGRAVRTVGHQGWVGHVIVEIEAANGQVGVGVSVGGRAACWIIEQHLSQFVLGHLASDVQSIWDLMWRGSLFYGRRGIVLHAISAIDLALWDLYGRSVAKPVYELLGGAARNQLSFYATTPNAQAAQEAGFIGCKLPLANGVLAGRDGIKRNVETFADARSSVGEDMFLAYDCWMALDVETAVELAFALLPYSPLWLEECLPPDDYWGYARLRGRFPRSIAVATGEHEGTRWGFRALSELGACDILQPDPTWCGGLTELMRIIAEAEVGGRRVVMHGSSVYGMHPSFAAISVPFAECILVSDTGAQVVPAFGDLFVSEPLPIGGVMDVSALSGPGFGLELNRDVELIRPARIADHRQRA